MANARSSRVQSVIGFRPVVAGTSGSSASSRIWISSGVMRVSTPRSPSASAAGLHQCEDIRAVDACWHVDHDPVPVGKLFDPCWHFSRSRQRLTAPMPLLAYLAGQQDPDGHMIIVALDLNVGMEIDVCHFPPVPELGHRCWPGLSGGSLVFVDEAA